MDDQTPDPAEARDEELRAAGQPMPDKKVDLGDDAARDHAQPDGERVDPASTEGQIIHLPSLISDEFGISRSLAREALKMGTIEMDGEPWEGDRFNLRREDILGKDISIVSILGVRVFRFTYKGDLADRNFPSS